MADRPAIPTWLVAAVVTPVLVLAVLAVIGLRSESQAARERARESAVAAASLQAERLARILPTRIERTTWFPTPPVPGPAAAAGDPLDGNDPEALAKIMRDPEAGTAPSGLPRRVLAALRLRALAPARITSRELLDLLTRAAPSVLTPVALATLVDLPAAEREAAMHAWQVDERARAAHARADANGWTTTADGTWWTRRAGTVLEFLPPEDWCELAGSAEVPGWAVLCLRHEDRTINAPCTGELLATAPVAFAGGLALDIRVVDPAAMLAGTRRQAMWTIALVVVALVVPVIAVFLIQSVLAKERRLAALKSQFVASVSHELRAPVGSIRLMAEALHTGKVSGEAARDFHALIASEGARLSHLVENVLDVARIEEGRKRYRFEECDLTELARDAARLIDPLARERGVTISTRLSDAVATVDPHAIQQAVVNLLDNAVKFSPAGKTVELVLEAAGPAAWKLSIRDDGPGIPAAEHERIFDRFHRLGNELRREAQGTGIGLSIVKHVAEAHGGTITVDSRPGHGSTFHLTIPANPAP